MKDLNFICFRLIRKIAHSVRKWFIRMETQVLISQIKEIGSVPAIKGPVYISSPKNVHLGIDVCINPGFHAHAEGGLFIGSHVHFGQNVRILTQNHNYQSSEFLPYDKKRISKPVTIGDCVWVGDNVCVVPGVTIGEGAVIGMGAVVTKDIPPLAVAGGSPARVIKMRDAETYARLKREGKFLGWPPQ